MDAYVFSNIIIYALHDMYVSSRLLISQLIITVIHCQVQGPTSLFHTSINNFTQSRAKIWLEHCRSSPVKIGCYRLLQMDNYQSSQ